MGWKRSELRVHNDGYSALARAVIKQWHIDGRPRTDAKGAQLWAQLLQVHMRNSTVRKDPYKLGVVV